MSEAAGDLELIDRCLGGDRDAFALLVERYKKPVYNVAYRILADAEEARDVTQAVLIKAWQNLGRYDRAFRFYSWIYKIAINEAINALKKTRRLEPLEEAGAIADGTDPERVRAQAELGDRVQRALMTLKAEYRVVIVLKHMLDCTYDEMEWITGVPEKTIKSRLFTARRLLRERLVQEGVR